MTDDIDKVCKFFMLLQIIMTSMIFPIAAAYIQNIFDFDKLIRCMAGLLLVTNIDNFIAELLKLQLEKNHSHLISSTNYMVFDTSQSTIDVAYWWVITLTALNLINCLIRSLTNKHMFCPNITQVKEALENDQNYFSSNAMKAVYYFNWFLIMFELLFIVMPFLSIPMVRFFVERGRNLGDDCQ